jgi:hypothetical protein
VGALDFLTPEVGGITEPPGDPGSLRGAARTFSATADVAETHLRRTERAAGSVVPSGWFGFAAWAFRTAVGWAAADLRAAPGAFRTAAGALETLASELQTAQEMARRAQARAADLNARTARLDQALAEAAASDADGPDLAALPGLAMSAGALQLEAMGIRAEAAEATQRAQEAARKAAAAFDQVTAMAPSVQRAIREYLEENPEEAKDRGFLECGVDTVADTGGMLLGLVNPFQGTKIFENWGNLGKGVWYGVTHPGDLVAEASGYNTAQREGLDCAAGELVPGIALTILSGGAGAAARGGSAANKLEKLGDMANTGRRLGNAADNAQDARRLSNLLDEVVPDEALRRVSGRRPYNYGYAGRVYPLSDDLAAKYPAGVRFTREGFPDFSPYRVADVEIDGLRATKWDIRKANEQFGWDKTPDGYTWHHVEDTRTLQLIPTDLHRQVRHTGGQAIIREALEKASEAGRR